MGLKKDTKRVLHILQKRRYREYVDDGFNFAFIPKDIDDDQHYRIDHESEEYFPDQQISDIFLGLMFIS